jgi:hypothetical protein
MNFDANDFHGINFVMNVPLQDWFSVDNDLCEAAIYVKDEAYN